jgi:hypothetical protein
MNSIDITIPLSLGVLYPVAKKSFPKKAGYFSCSLQAEYSTFVGICSLIMISSC